MASDATTGVRPMRADARRNYDALVSAAITAFGENGAEASLEDVARRAGVGIGTLYRHFPNREALIAEAYRSEVDELCAPVAELLATMPPDQALAAWLDTFVSYAARKRGLLTALKGAIGTDSEVFTYAHEKIRAAGTTLLDAAAASGAVRGDVDVWDLLRVVSGVCMASERSADADQARRMLGLVLDGLRYQPAPSSR